jgi:glycerophosphoryl diester phosphodiesterase
MKSFLVAHRGEPAHWPENSLPGFHAALQAGACFIETDIQITADGVAVLHHDASALKITGSDLPLTTTDYKTLHTLPAGYPERFAERFQDLRIARLDEFVALLQTWPEASAFIEVKEASIATHGIPAVIAIVLDSLRPVLQQCILISFNHELLAHARSIHPLPIGWALHEWSTDSKERATDLQPDYLFCNQKRLPPASEPLWQGPWKWVVYTINRASEVPPLLERGIQLVETDNISELLADPALEGQGCA